MSLWITDQHVQEEKQIIPFKKHHDQPISDGWSSIYWFDLYWNVIKAYPSSSFLSCQLDPMRNKYKTRTASSEFMLGIPWVSKESSWSRAICIIIRGVLRKLVSRSPRTCLIQDDWFFIVRVVKNWKEAVKVITQTVDPMGTPSRRWWIGASVSCQVHQRNLIPVMSYGAYIISPISPASKSPIF